MAKKEQILYYLLARGLERIYCQHIHYHEQTLPTLELVFQNIPLKLAEARSEMDYKYILEALQLDTRVHDWIEWAINDQKEYAEDTKILLHRLLYVLLVEVRARAYEKGWIELASISDLLHNIPIQLVSIAEARRTSEDVVQCLQERAKVVGLTPWLEQTMNDFSN